MLNLLTLEGLSWAKVPFLAFDILDYLVKDFFTSYLNLELKWLVYFCQSLSRYKEPWVQAWQVVFENYLIFSWANLFYIV